MTQPPSEVPPWQPPVAQVAPLGYAQPVRNDIRDIAVRQRAIMFCILGYLAAVIGQFAVPDNLRIFLAVLAIVVSVTAAVFVFMLSLAIYEKATGILLGIGTLIPCVGLICLLVVNGRATNILKANGIKVGLLGANMSQIPSPGTSVR